MLGRAFILYLLLLAALLFGVPILFAERAHGLATGELPHVCTTISSTTINSTSPTLVNTAAAITLTGLSGSATDVVAFADWNISGTGGTAERYYACTLRPTSTTGCGTAAQCGAPSSCLSAVTSAELEHSSCDYAHGQLLQKDELLGGATVGFAENVTATSQTWGLYCELNTGSKDITIDGGTVCAVGFRSWDGLVDLGAAGVFKAWTGDTTLSTNPASPTVVGDIDSLSLTVPTGGAPVFIIGAVAARPASGSGGRSLRADVYDSSSPIGQALYSEHGTGGMTSGVTYGMVTLGAGCSGGTCTRTLSLRASSASTVSTARKGLLVAIPLTSSGGTTYEGRGGTGSGTNLAVNTSVTSLATDNLEDFPSASANGPVLVAGSASFGPNATGSATRAWYARLHECSSCTTSPTDGNKLGGVFNGFAINQATTTYRQAALVRIKSAETANPDHRVDLTGSSYSSGDPIDATFGSVAAFPLIPDPTSLPPTPTPLPSNTATRTPTTTRTPTATLTQTPAPGCYVITVTPAASADDVLIRSTNNGAAALTSNGATITFGVYEAFTFDFEDVAALRFNVAPLIPDTATITAAWLNLYTVTTTASSGGTRHFIGKWTGNQGAWATGDFEDQVSPADAFDIAFPTGIATSDWYTIPLSNPQLIDIDTGYTGLKLGATNPGAPTTSDGIIWTFQAQDGTNDPVLGIAYCDATPTAASTATVTETPTRTPNQPHYSIPDTNEDGIRAIAINSVDEKLTGIMDNLATTLALGDPDTICSRISPGEPSATLYAQQVALTQAAQPGRCSVPGVTGTLWRGTNVFVDVEIIDTCPVSDAMLTWTAPDPEIAGSGVCCTAAGCSGTCRVNHRQGGIALGLNTLCSQGPSFGSACRRVDPDNLLTPTPCTDDPAPADSTGLTSWCKDNLYSVGDGADVTGCDAGLCWEQTREAATRWNVREAIRQAEERGAAVVLTCGPLQANWLRPELAADTTPAITPLPNGTPAPTQRARAPWEPAYRSHAYGRAHLRPMALAAPAGFPERSWIDFAMLAGDATHSQPWKFLGDAKTLASQGAGHCTCLVDSDCGVGGTCAGNRYCTAGTRNTCVKDTDCRGSNSQALPGTAYCLRPADALAAEAVQACLERWQDDRDPSFFHKGILDCGGLPESADRTPFGTQTPTRSVTPTITLTPIVAPTATNTHTAGPTPTPTSTATATNTSAVPPLPAATFVPNVPCWKAGDNGRLADIFGADMRRQVSEWSKCFSADGNALLSPVCDLGTGPSGFPDVPSSITYALTVPNNAQVNREVGRCGYHVIEDKVSKYCDDSGPLNEPFYYLYLAWDWVRYRAHALSQPVPNLETIDAHSGANGWRAWDAWFKMYERYYVRALLPQMRADLAASSTAGDQVCAGHVINQMGYRLLDDWVTRGNDKCWEAYSSAAVNNNCSAGVKPSQSTIRTWCDGYKTIIQPVWEGVRAAEGKPCRTGRCSTSTTIWCGVDAACPGGETCNFTGAVACP